MGAAEQPVHWLQLRADAARAAQGQQTQAILAAGGVVRSSSSKISHLVVGPDGIQLCIAHKERIKAALQPEQKHTIPRDMVSTTQKPLKHTHHDVPSTVTLRQENRL